MCASDQRELRAGRLTRLNVKASSSAKSKNVLGGGDAATKMVPTTPPPQ